MILGVLELEELVFEYCSWLCDAQCMRAAAEHFENFSSRSDPTWHNAKALAIWSLWPRHSSSSPLSASLPDLLMGVLLLV